MMVISFLVNCLRVKFRMCHYTIEDFWHSCANYSEILMGIKPMNSVQLMPTVIALNDYVFFIYIKKSTFRNGNNYFRFIRFFFADFCHIKQATERTNLAIFMVKKKYTDPNFVNLRAKLRIAMRYLATCIWIINDCKFRKW